MPALLCFNLAWAMSGLQQTVPRTWLQNGYVARTCAAWGQGRAGGFEAGVWWIRPSSTTGRFGRPKRSFLAVGSACGYVPWAPFLPRRGSLAWPQ